MLHDGERFVVEVFGDSTSLFIEEAEVSSGALRQERVWMTDKAWRLKEKAYLEDQHGE